MMCKNYMQLKIWCSQSFTGKWPRPFAFMLQSQNEGDQMAYETKKYLLSSSLEKTSANPCSPRWEIFLNLPNHLLHFKISFQNCILISMGSLTLCCVPFSKSRPGFYFLMGAFLNLCNMVLNFSEDTKVFKRSVFIFRKFSLLMFAFTCKFPANIWFISLSLKDE